MQGNVVAAAQWLGGLFIIGCAIMVGGMQWIFSKPSLPDAPPPPVRIKAQLELAPPAPQTSATYPSDPLVRMDQLMNQTEDNRQTGEVWRRFWFNDQPSHLTPYRVHGGI